MDAQGETHHFCSACFATFNAAKLKSAEAPKFCPYCGTSLLAHAQIASVEAYASIQEKPKPEDKILQTIGSFQILKTIGKGGMGEVFLAYDEISGRKIALKKIRKDLKEYKQIRYRFLKEARITSQLVHPAIIPIYSIHADEDLVYYTMPFVEGKTLKQLLEETQVEEKMGIKASDSYGSIPALARIFLSVCQAIAYAHSKGVLHRDIKPENIILGLYGEVLILDWGLAVLVHAKSSKEDEGEERPPELKQQGATHAGKVVGTVSYMAPERALGCVASFQSDVYSLGVILYQILTLRHPFRRKSLKEFKQNMQKEEIYDPSQVAPYRDVPQVLSQIALKCLAVSLNDRYRSVDDLIYDLENYIEGRSDWHLMGKLDVHNKDHWEFQENVLIAEQTAITRGSEVLDWVSLMISKASFAENIRIEARVKIGQKGGEVGFLMSVPEVAERVHLSDGYCLWIGSDLSRSTRLLRSSVEVINAPEIFLKKEQWYKVCIEKNENKVQFYLNDVLQFSYASHLPLVGTHIGVLSHDADYEIDDFCVYGGGQSLKVSCLAVPDAFLAHKNYVAALNEYRRIGYAFSGTAEGREALFRAGVTLLEQAKASPDKALQEDLYELALLEFGRLHKTPGAPLEYLGKGLVYQCLKDYEEEIKCFELAYRRYSNHPLLPILQEQIIYRMHQTSRHHRQAAFYFALLAARHFASTEMSSHTRKLFSSLKKHWGSLYFIEEEKELSDAAENLNLALQLAFWLSKSYILAEIIDEALKLKGQEKSIVCNSLYCLIKLGFSNLAKQKLLESIEKCTDDKQEQWRFGFKLIEIMLQTIDQGVEAAAEVFLQLRLDGNEKEWGRTALYLMEEALDLRKTDLVEKLIGKMLAHAISPDLSLQLDCIRIWAFLLDKKWKEAGEILHKYSLKVLTSETAELHFLYGCWLYAAEGKEIAKIHFASVLDVSFPHFKVLGSHFINKGPHEKQVWLKQAFAFEKKQLYRQLSLFYECSGDQEEAILYKQLEKKQISHDNG